MELNKHVKLDFKFKLPIGDWSGDGHDKCVYYTVQSSHPVEDVREMYFTACEKAGFDIAKVYLHDYADSEIKESQLEQYPLPMFDWDYFKEDSESVCYLGVDEFAELVLDWIKYYNPKFSYAIIKDDIPMLPFYGYDEKGRHIEFIGYGLFD